MVLLSAILRFVQELKSDLASEALQKMVNNTTSVYRNGETASREINISEIVPGDVGRHRKNDRNYQRCTTCEKHNRVQQSVFHGFYCCQRLGNRRGICYGVIVLSGNYCQKYCRRARSNEFRQGDKQGQPVAYPVYARDGAFRFFSQWDYQRRLVCGICFCSFRSRRANARNAADDCYLQSGKGRCEDGEEENDCQKPERHYGSRHCHSLYGAGRKDWIGAAPAGLFPLVDCHAALLLLPNAGDKALVYQEICALVVKNNISLRL